MIFHWSDTSLLSPVDVIGSSDLVLEDTVSWLLFESENCFVLILGPGRELVMAKSVAGSWVHIVDVDNLVLFLPEVESHGEFIHIWDIKVELSNVPCEKKLLKVRHLDMN